MNLIKLGRSGLSVSPLVLGTVNFSWLTDEKDSFAILDRALELGINFFDTSDNCNAGQTEALLGRWFAQGAGVENRLFSRRKFIRRPWNGVLKT